MSVYERHAVHATKCKEWLGESETLLPAGTIVSVKLNPQDKSDFSNKFGPLYMGPWVVVERFTNGKTYRVRDLSSEQERQVSREQLKVLDVPSEWKKEKEPWLTVLPRMGRVELGEGVLVPQDTSVGKDVNEENARNGGLPAPRVNENEGGNERGHESGERLGEDERGELTTGDSQDAGGRYSLRQVPERRALQAERRRLAAQK